MNSTSFAFAHRLKARLIDGDVTITDGRYFRVTGKIDAPAVLARIEIRVDSDFDRVIDLRPDVWCREPWMRSDKDWHNDRNGGMCWVLDKEWRDILGGKQRHPNDLVRNAVNWLLNNVQSLVSRHYYADLMKLNDWPKEWDAWEHYGAGVEQYEREQNERKRPKV